MHSTDERKNEVGTPNDRGRREVSISVAAASESQRGFDSYSDSVTLNLSFSLHTQMKCCFHAPLMYAESLFALREKITDASATIDDQLVVRSHLNMRVVSLFLHDQSERCYRTLTLS